MSIFHFYSRFPIKILKKLTFAGKEHLGLLIMELLTYEFFAHFDLVGLNQCSSADTVITGGINISPMDSLSMNW
jgi:hypothetical protein